MYLIHNMSALEWGRYCLTCNTYFKEIDSIGKWLCLYHPLPLDPDSNTFPCCGVSPKALLANGSRNPAFNAKLLEGCVRKDHSSTQFTFTEIDDIGESAWPPNLRIALMGEVFKIANGKSSTCHIIARDNDPQLYIRRYDKDEHDRQVRKGYTIKNIVDFKIGDKVNFLIKKKTFKGVVLSVDKKVRSVRLAYDNVTFKDSVRGLERQTYTVPFEDVLKVL